MYLSNAGMSFVATLYSTAISKTLRDNTISAFVDVTSLVGKNANLVRAT